MLAWVLSWFYGETKHVAAPARNAPVEDIKTFVENKPPEVPSITKDDITFALSNLHKIEPVKRPEFYTSPLINELHNVFKVDYRVYFEQKKIRSMSSIL